MPMSDVIKFWQESSDDAWVTAKSLLESKRFDHALFFCHLTLEKLLKAKYVEKFDKHSPPVHGLSWLAKEAEINLSEDEQKSMEEITTFNIAGRYGDYKKYVYKIADEETAKKWIKATENLINKIKQQ